MRGSRRSRACFMVFVVLVLVRGGWSECPASAGTSSNPVLIASPSAATWVGTQTDWEVCPSRAAEGGSSGDDYYWTFGDGLGRVQTSTGWASYTWGAPGSYNVKIHLSSSQSVEAMAYVRQCSSSGSGSSGPYVSALGRAEVGEELVFWLCPGSGSSGDTSGDTYLWDTDDGHQTEALANQVALRYTYQKPGDFRVTVRVNATTASEKSYSIAVNVAAPAPCPLLGIAGPTAVDVLEPVTFTVCGTKVGSASVTWHFGDGTKQTSNGASARHTYTQGGAFTVTAEVAGTTWTLSHVSVADCRSVNLDAGSTIVATASSTIEPQVPVSFALCEGFSVGAVPQQRSYQWLFGDTSQSSPSSAATTIGHTYLQPGTYSVEVRVSSRYDNTSGTVNTTVRGSVTVAAGNSAACPQGSIASNSSITNVSSLVGFQTCGSLPTGQLTWIFGDGAASTTPQHTYKKWALYTVSLQVGEAASPLYQTVQAVLDCPKNLKETRIVVGGEAVADEQVAFALCIGADHAAQFRSLPTPLFQWTLGDGAISRQSPIEQAFVYTYQKTGTYAVVVDIVNTTLQFNTTITVAASASSGNATYDSTAEIIVGIIFSVISGLLFLGGFVYLAYRYFKKRTGTAFSVSRPSTDYFLMRNEDEDEDSDRDSQA